jgi:hypothetical protein
MSNKFVICEYRQAQKDGECPIASCKNDCVASSELRMPRWMDDIAGKM